MPKGKKTCPECQAELGVRTKVCACGYAFPVKEKKQKTQAGKRTKKSDDSKEAQEAKKPIHELLRAPILIPSGEPPFAPKGYKGGSKPVWSVSDPWPEPASDDDISEWAWALKDHYSKKGKILTTRGVIYYARYFWDVHSPEYLHACDIIAGTFTVRLEEDEQEHEEQPC